MDRLTGERATVPFLPCVAGIFFPRFGMPPKPGTSGISSEVIRAIRRWKREHGQVPSMADWSHGATDHPSFGVAIDRFGSWRAALRVAPQIVAFDET